VDDTKAIIGALKNKFPQIESPPKDDICYATTNRQFAVKELAGHCDLILVIGAQNSSNSQRLREVAQSCGTPAYLIDNEESLKDEWFENVATVGVTAGASAPEVLVERLIEDLKNRGAKSVDTLEITEENVYFKLPPDLKQLPVVIGK
jgi:4-hydroxy-3-methylbut-2-enyl diphosphate reductase